MDDYVTVTQLQAKLNLSRATIYRLMARGLPSVTIGQGRRFLWRQVDSWIRGDVVTPGDYRCLVCEWVGHITAPRAHYSIHCPHCQTLVPQMVRVDDMETR